MDTSETSHWRRPEGDFQAEGIRTPPRPYRIPREYPARPASQPAERGYLPYPPPPGYPSAGLTRPVSRRLPEAPPALLRPAHRQPASQRPEPADRQHRIRRPRTRLQLIGGIVLAGACVVTALWYVPRVMSDDRRLITGTVTSSGIVTLNFTYPGQISKVTVHPDQAVRKGEVLAAEYDPNAGAVIAADEATLTSMQAKIAELKAAAATDPAAAAADNAQIAADKAQIAVDQAQLATDRTKVAATEIVAPAGGMVIATNGQPGETVTASGIRDYAADSQQAATAQGPQFSLLPEGPQATHRIPATGSALPVIALRTSTTWQVVALIGQGAISGIKTGQTVTVAVPAAHIVDIPGQVDEVVPNPATTSAGVFYQVVVAITGHAVNLPLNGMTADLQLAAPSP